VLLGLAGALAFTCGAGTSAATSGAEQKLRAALADDLDPDSVEAKYRDGVLHVTIKRLASAQPRRINVN